MSTRVKTTTDVNQDVAKKLKKARKTMLNRPIQYAAEKALEEFSVR